VTACTKRRRPAFAAAADAEIARHALLRLVEDGDVAWLVGTVMPEHVHFLFELGARLPLERVQSKFKGLVSRKHSMSKALWQENAFEHRLRETEDSEDYAFYIFMNPYRAQLIPIDCTWPWWVCTDTARLRFLEGLDENGTPPSEWLDRVNSIAAKLATGE
jgi:REP element-mobilizing transposase RayT